MTLNGAIKQLHELQCNEDVPVYVKPAIAEVINVLLMDVQEVRHGHWININGTGIAFRCSVCGEMSCCNEAYCNECGARMDLDEVTE